MANGGQPRLREGAGVRYRFRSRVWRELPFSARRAIVGTLRTVDRIDQFFTNLWRSLHHSPAWLFVAVVGTTGIALTIALFFSLTQQVLADGARGSGSSRVVPPDASSSAAADVLDTRLFLDERPASPAYRADFEFGRSRTHTVARTPVREPPAEPVDEPPLLDDPPSRPPRRTAAPLPDEPAGEPDLRPRVSFQRHRGPDTALEETVETLVARAGASVATRADELELEPRTADGWGEHRAHPLTEEAAPARYHGDVDSIIHTAAAEDEAFDDATAWSDRAEIAIRVELHAPEFAAPSQVGRSSLVLRNIGSETIRRVQIAEPIAPLDVVVDASPAGRVQDDILQREFLRLRPGRERILSLDWQPVSLEPRTHAANIRAEAFVAAVVEIEGASAPLEGPLEPMSAEVPEQPVRPRRTPLRSARAQDEAPQEPRPERPRPPAPIEQPVDESPPVEPPQRRAAVDVTVRTARSVPIGEIAELAIEVRNTGDTILRDVRILAQVPQELRHRHGPQLEYDVGRLSAGATHQAVLRVVGSAAGASVTRLRVVARDAVEASAEARLAVVEPSAPSVATPRAAQAAPRATPTTRTVPPTDPCCVCPCGPRVVWIGPGF